MKTLHLVFSSHIDPIWLWPWQSGLAEVVATCRSACDRLDTNPDLFFTRGEAWVYEQIERVDPKLFGRIRGHIEAGRWEVIGGWYIQPDCNLPSYWAMEQQVRLGKQYFLDRFCIFPKTAFNVDSFGHAAALPGLMRAFGQDSYLTTRPSWEEMAQPARVFRWRGYTDGPEVVVIHPQFSNSHELNLEMVSEAIDRRPEGLDHAMCCLGVGDHGGGVTEYQIAWCREHFDAIPGWKMEFSTVGRFMEQVRTRLDVLPLVVGELQPHSIGCYSVYRPVKVALRRAEHLLAQAATLGPQDEGTEKALADAWKRVAFHHFHDTLAGTCTPTAYIPVLDQLGGACAVAEETLRYGLQRRVTDLLPNELQRIVLLDAGEEPFAGFVEHEPWVGPWARRWLDDCSLVDSEGNPIEFQLMDAESIAFTKRNDTVLPRILFPASMEPGQVQSIRIKRGGDPAVTKPRVHVLGNDTIFNDLGTRWSPKGLEWPTGHVLPFRLDLIRDMSDTWSHGLFRYADDPLESERWGDPTVVDSGPLMASVIADGSIGKSSLRAEWRVYAGMPYVDLKLDVHWLEQFRLLKLVLPFSSDAETRTDGVMGKSLVRRNDGSELPLRDWTLVGNAGNQLGIVAPDVYGIDATPKRIRLTLLRSPLMAHHEPAPLRASRGVFSDQGAHTFRFRFLYGADLPPETLDWHASMMQRPIVITDATEGMPTIY